MVQPSKCKLALAFALLSLTACATSQPHPTISHRSPPAAEQTFSNYQAIGIASWYGGKFHGRKTANGERFNQHALTCAHRTLPFGTQLKVTNIENGKTLLLRVNDRGPVRKSRLLDVSKAAAKQLGFLKRGLAKVEVVQVSQD